MSIIIDLKTILFSQSIIFTSTVAFISVITASLNSLTLMATFSGVRGALLAGWFSVSREAKYLVDGLTLAKLRSMIDQISDDEGNDRGMIPSHVWQCLRERL